MNMIVNGAALVIGISVFVTFVAQVLAPHRRSTLWNAPPAAPLTLQFTSMDVSPSAEVLDLDAHRRPAPMTVPQPMAA